MTSIQAESIGGKKYQRPIGACRCSDKESSCGRSILDMELESTYVMESTIVKEDEKTTETYSLRDLTPVRETRTYDLMNESKIPKSIIKAIESMNIRELNWTQTKILHLLMTTEHKGDIYLQMKPNQNDQLSLLITSLAKVDESISEPQIVILCPTVEIVARIKDDAEKLVKYSKISIAQLEVQNKNLHYSPGQVICSTISAFFGLLVFKKIIDFRCLKLIVFSEFQMFINSFKLTQYARKLIKLLKKTTQIRFFSTSFDRENELNFIERYAIRLKTFCMTTKEEYLKNLIHFVVLCKTHREKYKALISVLRNNKCNKVLVFAASKTEAAILNWALNRDGFPNQNLTTDFSTADRLRVIENFRTDLISICVLNYPLNVGTFNMPENRSVLIVNFEVPIYSGIKFFNEYASRSTTCLTDRSSKPSFVVNIIDTTNLKFMNDLEGYFSIKMFKLDAFSSIDYDLNDMV